MVTKKSKKLPEGVGKRIIETLKNQELDTDLDEEIEAEVEETVEVVEEVISEEAVPEEIPEIKETVEEVATSEVELSVPEPQPVESYQTQETYEQKEPIGVSDIDTLLTLISQLPSGVTKQTGALIIRQTMEAMGISMNKVLSDAQSVQEEFENNIRNNVNVIEEYRTKIKILEQEIQKYRKKSHELEDVISLFILSGDKK